LLSTVEFGEGTVVIAMAGDSIVLPVEVAETDAQKAFGLMRRPSLEPGRGMIFLYPAVQDTTMGFWMFQTQVPLDIAFVDSAGTIASIRTMDPCESTDPQWCPVYLPGVRYQQALEVNRGFFAAQGVGVGSVLRFVRPDER